MRENFTSWRPRLPSAWASANSRNSSELRLCNTLKPSRQAWCARAQANQLLPIPVGPINRIL